MDITLPDARRAHKSEGNRCFPSPAQYILQHSSKIHNAPSRLVNGRVSSLHKRMITPARMSPSDPRRAGVNLGLLSLSEEAAGFGMLLWLPGSPRKPRCQLLRSLSCVVPDLRGTGKILQSDDPSLAFWPLPT